MLGFHRDAHEPAMRLECGEDVRDELAGTAAAPAEAPQASELEAELETLQTEVAALRAEASSKGKTK